MVLQFTVECEDWYIFAALNVVYALHALGSTLIVEGFRDFWGVLQDFASWEKPYWLLTSDEPSSLN